MSFQGGNMENLLERILQMNTLIIQEMHEQRKQFIDHAASISSASLLPSSAIIPETVGDSVVRSRNKIHVKPKEFNGTNNENVVTWLSILEEVMTNHSIIDAERVSLAASLLGGTALQWFVNLKLKNLRPASWNDFKEQITLQFQPIDFQENLRQQLLHLRQQHALQEYIYAFRNLIGQVNAMDELTQVMLFINGLSSNTGLYVRSKHPQTVEAAIREATTYDNVMTISKNTHIKYDPFLETSSTVELNAINTQQQRHRYSTPFNSTTTKDDCFKFGLCFYCKEAGHRALKCPKKGQKQHVSTASYSKNDQR
jgi:hypothetical protein